MELGLYTPESGDVYVRMGASRRHAFFPARKQCYLLSLQAVVFVLSTLSSVPLGRGRGNTLARHRSGPPPTT